VSLFSKRQESERLQVVAPRILRMKELHAVNGRAIAHLLPRKSKRSHEAQKKPLAALIAPAKRQAYHYSRQSEVEACPC
jgi:hypothetical protein